MEGQLYHVIGRGIERRKIFLDADDYNDFLARLKTALEKTGAKCLAWCLMPNHFHLLILRAGRPLSELMRRLMTGYALGFNARNKRCGHLFQNRYKAVLCAEEEYLLELAAYIHLNPLRAKLVRGAEELKEFRWCGHGALCGEKAAGFMDKGYILRHFGRDEKTAVMGYEKFVLERTGKFKSGEFSGGGLIRSMGGIMNAMRNLGSKEMFDARVLGGGEFVEAVLKAAGMEKPTVMTRAEVLSEVGRITGIVENDLKRRTRQRKISWGRAVYCYLMKEKCGVGGGELAREFALTAATISYLVRKGQELVEGK